MDSFEPFGKAVMMLSRQNFHLSKMQVTFYTDKDEVEKQMETAKEIFKARDARTKDSR